MASINNRRFLAPEVVQTSAMDCGPASLKCLLEGFGIPVSYGRLREACQTDVDGTSIDTMEEVASLLGLDAEQVMVPADHLLLPESKSLPGIAVVRLANGLTHFVVVWRAIGRFVQVMDPATGRRWMPREQLLRELYLHTAIIPASSWRTWVEGDSFLNSLRRRLHEIGASKAEIEELIHAALADKSWRSAAALDAATRMTAAIVQAGGISRGRQAARILQQFAAYGREEAGVAPTKIPSNYWMALPVAPQSRALNGEGEEQLKVRGAVLVQTRGRRLKSDERRTEQELSPELSAALQEMPARPGRNLLGLLLQDGMLTPLTLIVALFLATGGLMIESVLFQGLFDLGHKLALTEQRLGAMATLIVFAMALLFLEWPIAASTLKMGRRLEIRLHMAFLKKIPRLGDRYFQSRLISDMTERSHNAQALRQLPHLGGRFLRLLFELALTTAGLVWLDPGGAWAVVSVAVTALVLPLALQSRLTERDLRIRNHDGALSRFYLDGMRGLSPVRVHGAIRTVCREHESLLVEWMRASYAYLRAVVTVETAQTLIGFGLAAWLLFNHLSGAGGRGTVLLMVYWALNLPALGQGIAMVARQYPFQRNLTLRLLEPLGALEEQREHGPGYQHLDSRSNTLSSVARTASLSCPAIKGVAVSFENVSVRISGHLVLDRLDLRIAARSHVAIVGRSGAGKSSFVGLLLGWHRASGGRVMVDGEELIGERLTRLRRETAWVDPAVQLWNRPFLDNLRYGSDEQALLNLSSMIDAAELRSVLEKLPDGLQTTLGESGGLVSGGEGQRVRFGRAFMKADARLVILDEPFRGLDRAKRKALLERARERWRDATLLWITHDVSETLGFDRVLVMDKGRIVEDAPAFDLASHPGSLYQALLEAEESVRTTIWESNQWRRLRMENGRIVENEPSVHSVWQAGALSPIHSNGHGPLRGDLLDISSGPKG